MGLGYRLGCQPTLKKATGNHNLRELGVSGITRTGSLTGVEVQGACKNVKPTSVQKFADHFLDVVRPGRPLHPIRALFHPAAGSHAQPHAGGASQSNQPQSGEPSQPRDGTGGAAPQNNPPQPGSE
ncbi:hypothetical protein D9757_006554 [Collybiopsis confluens]|uniref:Uncharacterized protein n=1 Tax=Collybiopsis confluens TaxID=2823264 RepID=A0A8H5MBF0_9AGAR|nr:hypothetical protein D9757_006554 [Collybiopsis confluens]